MTAWTYRYREPDADGLMPRCEECCGAIRDRIRLERRLQDGQYLVVEHVHVECASRIERMIAGAYHGIH